MWEKPSCVHSMRYDRMARNEASPVAINQSIRLLPQWECEIVARWCGLEERESRLWSEKGLEQATSSLMAHWYRRHA